MSNVVSERSYTDEARFIIVSNPDGFNRKVLQGGIVGIPTAIVCVKIHRVTDDTAKIERL